MCIDIASPITNHSMCIDITHTHIPFPTFSTRSGVRYTGTGPSLAAEQLTIAALAEGGLYWMQVVTPALTHSLTHSLTHASLH